MFELIKKIILTNGQRLFDQFNLDVSSHFILTTTLIVILSLALLATESAVYKLLTLGALSLLVIFGWIFTTEEFLFIYLGYIVAFTGAVLMLFLSVILMLPISFNRIASAVVILFAVGDSTGGDSPDEEDVPSIINLVGFSKSGGWLEFSLASGQDFGEFFQRIRAGGIIASANLIDETWLPSFVFWDPEIVIYADEDSVVRIYVGTEARHYNWRLGGWAFVLPISFARLNWHWGSLVMDVRNTQHRGLIVRLTDQWRRAGKSFNREWLGQAAPWAADDAYYDPSKPPMDIPGYTRLAGSPTKLDFDKVKYGVVLDWHGTFGGLVADVEPFQQDDKGVKTGVLCLLLPIKGIKEAQFPYKAIFVLAPGNLQLPDYGGTAGRF